MSDGPYRNLVPVIIHNILEGAYRVRPALSFRRLRSASSAAPADASDLNPETAAVPISVTETTVTNAAVRIGLDFFEYFGVGGDYGGAAEGACLVGDDPRVDAVGVERVAADWQQTELIMRLELRQTHRAVASGEVSGDRTECEERQRIQQTGRRRRVALLVVVGRIAPQDYVVCGREGAVEALGEKAEEEINGGGDDNSRSYDDNDYDNGRRGDRG